MDEETSIIDNNTRNEKIRNFFATYKKSLSIFIIIIISILIGYFAYTEYKENQTVKISDQYNSILSDYSDDNREKTRNLLVELIYKNDPTYSPLSLNFIIPIIRQELKLNLDYFANVNYI